MSDKAKAVAPAAAATPGAIVFNVIFSPDDRALLIRAVEAAEKLAAALPLIAQDTERIAWGPTKTHRPAAGGA